MKCTIDDAKPMHRYDVSDLPHPSDILHAYLVALEDGEWHGMGDLRKMGCEHHAYFDELHQRGLVDGLVSPHEIRNGRAYGSRYWFRITGAGLHALCEWQEVPF